MLETHSNLGRCAVGKIRRQHHAEYRQAVLLLSDGNARGGLEALDQLGWVKEGEANYLKAAAADYFKFTENGQKLDQCLVVSPTWDENYRLTEEIRTGLKDRGVLLTQGVPCTVYDSLGWTNQQKQTPPNYEIGQVVHFNQKAGDWEKGATAFVSRVEGSEVWVRSTEGIERPVPLTQSTKFDVAQPCEIEIAAGDKILIRANDPAHGLINGQVLTVQNIEQDGALQTKEGLTVPGSYRQWTHGYVMTSHKAQGQTDRVP